MANLKLFCFTGFIAWWLWASVHIFFLIGFANRLLVTLQWAISFLTKRHGVRIFPGPQEATARKLGREGALHDDILRINTPNDVGHLPAGARANR
ncbi:MAG: hypothetical protein WDO69_15410 [Pseudomonadota bacterium]